MSTSPLVKPEYTQCLVCGAFLGSDSRDSGIMFCHDCRCCVVCKGELSYKEAKWVLDAYMDTLEEGQEPAYKDLVDDIKHPRCSVLTHRPSPGQPEMDYLNLLRLSVIPDMDLSLITNENVAMNASARLVADMDFEQMSLHLKMLQACEAQVRIAILQHPKYRKEALAEREKRHFDKARKEATTSSRPVGKPVDAPEEIALGTFMELHGLTERKTAQKIFSQRNKTIADLVKLGVPETLARESVNADMLKNGMIKK